ncbi:hypothetical protein GCM10022234_19190 [Aeromicrobium panaciterrae]|uniref:acetyl-CoA carboxylase biotin carboxyl carrier protein subunit n=1 Tax=Aeromicrobium panaciterrae TaxID=363861 RepID=UPI0031DE5AA5
MDVEVRSEVAGTVTRVQVSVGQDIAVGGSVVHVEAMKMDIPVSSPIAGLVREIRVAEGDPVAENQVVAIVGDDT